MYQVGDTVMYGTEGVCTIADLQKMKVGRETSLYYVLRPVYREGSTIFVPVGNETLTAKMRRLLTKEDIDSLLAHICREELNWIEDAAERKAEFHRILTAGDRKELLGMIRALYLHRQSLQSAGKRLRTNDDQMLRDAEKLLNDEFALVLNIQPHEVSDYIRVRVEEPAAN